MFCRDLLSLTNVVVGSSGIQIAIKALNPLRYAPDQRSFSARSRVAAAQR
jgi:hypothetical protein